MVRPTVRSCIRTGTSLRVNRTSSSSRRHAERERLPERRQRVLRGPPPSRRGARPAGGRTSVFGLRRRGREGTGGERERRLPAAGRAPDGRARRDPRGAVCRCASTLCRSGPAGQSRRSASRSAGGALAAGADDLHRVRHVDEAVLRGDPSAQVSTAGPRPRRCVPQLRQTTWWWCPAEHAPVDRLAVGVAQHVDLVGVGQRLQGPVDRGQPDPVPRRRAGWRGSPARCGTPGRGAAPRARRCVAAGALTRPPPRTTSGRRRPGCSPASAATGAGRAPRGGCRRSRGRAGSPRSRRGRARGTSSLTLKNSVEIAPSTGATASTASIVSCRRRELPWVRRIVTVLSPSAKSCAMTASATAKPTVSSDLERQPDADAVEERVHRQRDRGREADARVVVVVRLVLALVRAVHRHRPLDAVQHEEAGRERHHHRRDAEERSCPRARTARAAGRRRPARASRRPRSPGRGAAGRGCAARRSRRARSRARRSARRGRACDDRTSK